MHGGGKPAGVSVFKLQLTQHTPPQNEMKPGDVALCMRRTIESHLYIFVTFPFVVHLLW